MAKSRWGGYNRGRSFVQSGRTIRSGALTIPAQLDYRDATGIWNMKSSQQFPKVQGLQMQLSSSGFLGNAATVTTYTIAIPVAASAGDFAVAFFALNNTLATMTTPTGWTLVSATTGQQPQSYIFYKTLAAGDLNTSISGTGATATQYSSGIMTFNGGGNFPSTADPFSYTVGANTNTSSAGAVAPVISSSGGTGSVVAVGYVVGNPTAQVNTVSITNASGTLVCDNTTGMTAGNITMAYAIFNSGTTPLDLSFSTNDAGRQAGGGFYINCTLG